MCEAGTYISCPEAAQLLKTTETRILMMLKSGELSGKPGDDGWQVEKVSLDLCNKPTAGDIVKPGRCGGGCGGGCAG